MNIIIFTGIFEPEIGGPAFYVPKLAQGLVEVGHSVHVVSFSDKKYAHQEHKYDFLLTRIVRKSIVSNLIRMFACAWRDIEKYDVVYLFDYTLVGLPIALAAKLKRKKYIVRVGGDYMWEKYMRSASTPVTLRDFYKNNSYRKLNAFYYIIRFVLGGAHHIIFNNDVLGGVYEKFFGIAPNKHSVIYNPSPKVAATAPRKEGGREIIFTGRFIPLKNLSNLIKAFVKLPDSFKLVLIGDGPDLLNLKDTIGALGVADRVIIESPMGKERLWERLLQCYLLVLPSISDISPNLISECLQLHVPFVVTRETFLPFRDQLPLTFDPLDLDQMTDVLLELTRADVYSKYVTNLQNINWNYSWTECVQDHLKVFNSII